MKKISIVIPLFNEEESLNELYSEIKNNISDYDYEIIFIDDGSTDNSWKILMNLCEQDERMKIVKFYNNYGKAEALSEGFSISKGDYVITMDADLQDNPKEIKPIIEKIDQGWDLVSGWKKDRKDPINKTLPSKFFNFVIGFFTGLKIHDYNCGLKGYRKKVIKSLNLYGGLHRYIPAIALQNGYKITEIEVNHRSRKYGKTKYDRKRFFHGFFDLITVLFLGKYTYQPLHFFGLLGIIGAAIGSVIEVYVLYLKYILGEPFQLHFALLMLGVLFIVIGIQFFSIGLIGDMIVRSNPKKRDRVDIIHQEDSKK
jgi:glycosyltransferase involved in cell wall biosynthesis